MNAPVPTYDFVHLRFGLSSKGSRQFCVQISTAHQLAFYVVCPLGLATACDSL